tara:strand:- start:38 stop:418 length:381 start_codon:yes stop_codon:yes gene_type:complete
MVSIYCIEDINNLNYIGSTNQELNKRLNRHRYDKRHNFKPCSSIRLNLDRCKIYELEKCQESNRKERERYWINNMECVNIMKLNFDAKTYDRKEYQKQYRQYELSWGGRLCHNNNSLLKIDIDIFN